MKTMNKLNQKKSFYIALAAFAAVIIWIYVDFTGSPDGTARVITKEFKDIPIEYLADDTVLADRGLMLLEDGTDTTVDLTLQGTRWDIARVDREDILVQADLSNITTTGSQSVSNKAGFTVRGLAQVVEFSDIKPFMATVNIGELYSKSVDVHYEIAGNVAEGYSAGELQLSPTSFEIRGLEEAIAPVSYAKVVLNIGEDATATVSETLQYQLYDENDQLLEQSGIHSDVEEIRVTLPVNVTKELLLTMNFLESPGARLSNVKYTLAPETITVTGDAEQLKNIDKLVLSDFNLLNLNSSTIYNYTIPIPEGCENLSGVTRATLQVAFQDMASAEVTTNRFRYTNLPEGKHVNVLTEELTVKLFGTSEDLAAISGENVLVVADLTDFSAAVGSYTVPATVQIETGGDIGVTGTYQVRVNITAAQEDTGETPEDEATTQE